MFTNYVEEYTCVFSDLCEHDTYTVIHIFYVYLLTLTIVLLESNKLIKKIENPSFRILFIRPLTASYNTFIGFSYRVSCAKI